MLILLQLALASASAVVGDASSNQVLPKVTEGNMKIEIQGKERHVVYQQEGGKLLALGIADDQTAAKEHLGKLTQLSSRGAVKATTGAASAVATPSPSPARASAAKSFSSVSRTSSFGQKGRKVAGGVMTHAIGDSGQRFKIFIAGKSTATEQDKQYLLDAWRIVSKKLEEGSGINGGNTGSVSVAPTSIPTLTKTGASEDSTLLMERQKIKEELRIGQFQQNRKSNPNQFYRVYLYIENYLAERAENGRMLADELWGEIATKISRDENRKPKPVYYEVTPIVPTTESGN